MCQYTNCYAIKTHFILFIFGYSSFFIILYFNDMPNGMTRRQNTLILLNSRKSTSQEINRLIYNDEIIGEHTYKSNYIKKFDCKNFKYDFQYLQQDLLASQPSPASGESIFKAPFATIILSSLYTLFNLSVVSIQT